MDVRAIQTALKAAGPVFDPGPIDGIVGPRTKAAAFALYQALMDAEDVQPAPLPSPEPTISVAFTKPSRPVDRIFIHCSASDNAAHDNAATMDRWHKERGWAGIGYHFFIRKDGTLEIGRSIEKIPAAQASHNTGTIAICLHGLAKEKFTQAQFVTLRGLCAAINDAYGGKVTFHGHREVAAKECPVFDYRAVLDLDGKGRLGKG